MRKKCFIFSFILLMSINSFSAEISAISRNDFKIFDKTGIELFFVGDLVGHFIYSDFVSKNTCYEIKKDNIKFYSLPDSKGYSLELFFKAKEKSICFHDYQINRIIAVNNDFIYPRGIQIGDSVESIRLKYKETPNEIDSKLIYKYSYFGPIGGDITYYFYDEKLVKIQWYANW